MPELTFQEDGHIYRIDGIERPSTTQIIKAAGLSDFSMVRADVLERARLWGNAVHKMAELWLKGTIDLLTLDEALFGPLKALERWYAEHNIGTMSGGQFEIRGFHPKLLYTGTPDMKFPKLLIDIKSRLDPLAAALQVVAYDEMDGGDREHRILILNEDGTYDYPRVNATKAKRKESWSRFRYCYDLMKMREEIAKWK